MTILCSESSLSSWRTLFPRHSERALKRLTTEEKANLLMPFQDIESFNMVIVLSLSF